MPLHTIGLLDVSILHNQSDQEVHPSNFGPNQTDFFDEWESYLEHVLRERGVRAGERYFTVERKRARKEARERLCELDYGHFGTRRRVRNAVNGEHVSDIDAGEVPSDPLRLLLRSPVNGTRAFIAHEVVGRASVVGVLAPDLKKWFQKRHNGYRLEIDYVEDADAWNDFLDGSTLRELTFVAHRRADGNRAGRPTTEYYDVRPVRGEALPQNWLRRLRSDGHLPASEVLSIGVDDGDIDETRIVVQKNGRRRTIAIGADWPRFTWEIDPGSNQRPGDQQFYDVARSLIGDLLSRLNIDA
ncbi:MAG TPA: hypothetical protein DHW40_06050 [Microbacterium sp.]|nr:hypothetical protein [Microbacterium sp.]